ncbi:hypothetical protein EJ02DRAFT_492701 [Clathrospora elynae]|uniref:DUF6604 domain-containing protein n=1 Tax=Clathrospora elynae TaxID=706981 RepID=A0A6A5S1I9_9PLEO|nr:hypothetical protein EJ02DRAFT_492701 [Clathrospora elynae]
MPGLPKNILSTYQTYKNHTNFIAQWLATTARKHGYVSPKVKNTSKIGNIPQGRPTYTLASKEWTKLAEFIARLTDLPVDVPLKIATLLDTTISLRQSFSNDLSNVLNDSDAKQDSDATHGFFLGILKKVRDVLQPRLLKKYALVKKLSTPAEIINVFEHLELDTADCYTTKVENQNPKTKTQNPKTKTKNP